MTLNYHHIPTLLAVVELAMLGSLGTDLAKPATVYVFAVLTAEPSVEGEA